MWDSILNSWWKCVLISFIAGCLIVWWFIATGDNDYTPKTYEKELIVGAEEPKPEYCLRNTVTGQSGEVIIEEQQGGEYDYQLIATTRGIEVWVPCE